MNRREDRAHVPPPPVVSAEGLQFVLAKRLLSRLAPERRGRRRRDERQTSLYPEADVETDGKRRRG